MKILKLKFSSFNNLIHIFFFRNPLITIIHISLFRLNLHKLIYSLNGDQLSLKISLTKNQPCNIEDQIEGVCHQQTNYRRITVSSEHAIGDTRHIDKKAYESQSISKPIFEANLCQPNSFIQIKSLILPFSKLNLFIKRPDSRQPRNSRKQSTNNRRISTLFESRYLHLSFKIIFSQHIR